MHFKQINLPLSIGSLERSLDILDHVDQDMVYLNIPFRFHTKNRWKQKGYKNYQYNKLETLKVSNRSGTSTSSQISK